MSEAGADPSDEQFTFTEDTRPERFGFVGVILVDIGLALLLVAYLGVDWYQRGTIHPAHFADVGRELDQLGGAAAVIPGAYFGWLGWVLLVISVLLGIAANIPSPASVGLRAGGALAGFCGVAVTMLSIKLVSQGGSYSLWWSRIGTGFYLAAVGFLVVAIGAMIGPRRVG